MTPTEELRTLAMAFELHADTLTRAADALEAAQQAKVEAWKRGYTDAMQHAGQGAEATRKFLEQYQAPTDL